MSALEFAALALLLSGTGFFVAGTVGMLRFPDPLTRLHALTKADNLGLALTALGLIVVAGSWTTTVKVVVIWLCVTVSSATAAHLIARHVLNQPTPAASKP